MSATNLKPKRRTQEERLAASTEAILESAVQLVVEHGSSVSLAKVGDRAGFSHGLVMSRFQSKLGLVKAVCRRSREQFVAEMLEASAGNKGVDALLAMADVFSQSPVTMSSAGKAFFVLLGESMGPDREIRQEFLETDDAFRKYIKLHLHEAISAGDVDTDLEVETTAFIIVGMFRGVMMQQIINPKSTKRKKLRERLRVSVLNILGCPPGRLGGKRTIELR